MKVVDRLRAVESILEPEEGGETQFFDIGRNIVVDKGSAVMFYNLKHGCDGVNPSCVDAVSPAQMGLLYFHAHAQYHLYMHAQHREHSWPSFSSLAVVCCMPALGYACGHL